MTANPTIPGAFERFFLNAPEHFLRSRRAWAVQEIKDLEQRLATEREIVAKADLELDRRAKAAELETNYG